ncbi:hypothetical protein F2Q70_00017181 [Brassica cretica]|uniref:Uncharacterized protein n=1 Tax=Brassica cretica TaxID=69181 RepID=A0A8S9HXP6_BRACR|nr:hypothetical protein F2Q70_00017181 [Brassica cretica]
MTGGDGKTSYARNSTVQGQASSDTETLCLGPSSSSTSTLFIGGGNSCTQLEHPTVVVVIPLLVDPTI